MSDAELIAILLGCSGVPRKDVLQVAGKLLGQFENLEAIEMAELCELTRIEGIGPAKAARIKAAMELGRRAASRRPHAGTTVRSAADIARWFRCKIGHLRKEVFWGVGLDSKNRLIRAVRVAEGHLAGVEVHPREAFAPLLKMGAAGVLFVHNHPSGDPEPSSEDIGLTRRLVEVGELLGIRVVDHVVVGRRGFSSLL